MRGLLEAMRVLRGHDSAFRGCESVCKFCESACKGHKSTCRGMRVFAGALVMSTKLKRKQKRSDIEAKDRNETKTF
jgi:hypothetical protein